MKSWTAEQVAEAAGARLIAPAPSRAGPEGVTIDSRAVGAGELFVGLPGERADGGRFAPQALAAGAWGVLVAPEHADAARCAVPGALLASADPLRALQRLATAWRRELGAKVIAVTGSTGKTSTKDILRGVLAPHVPTMASEANLNTDIGLPLAVLRAPAGTRALVLEVAMRGPGEIAELTEIAEPDVGVIVNIGPVHLELLGSLEAIAAVKAELIAGMAPDTTVIVPADEPLLAPYRREDLRTVTFGEGGDVRLVAAEGEHVEIDAGGERIELEVDFTQAHFRLNLLAAVAAALAAGVRPSGRVEVAFSALRGERLELADDVLVINDCYNANPMSMRAALDDLAVTARGRRVAVLGDMLELGPQAAEFHAEVGRYASARGVDVLVTVGPLSADTAAAFDGEVHSVADAGEAAALVGELVAPGDTVLVKASRGIGLEVVAKALAGAAEASA
ncbi:MAG: UDP-N-acetylmuramoyl-tripeptide--D-alanyl-D-alanine ligase [Solirubrobacteraceae bacterium]|jgi:UDP-N-acetylmuramoyl-tripeptide--D-alanyl-D-alanine ligase|nr:UDP-N-acetylmuramoyl-tripeptide--D-alanyl-D-alanine ligase [Solirubrobacteraceae bacterium]